METGKRIGIVLAGGRSTRMGSNKAFLTLPSSGVSLLDHSVAVLGELIRRGELDDVVVSGSLPGYQSVPDRRSGIGPLGGIEGVLLQNAYRSANVALIIPVDLPKVSVDVLSKLMKVIDLEQTVDAAYYCDFYLPLVLRVNERLLQLLARLTNEKMAPRERSVHNLLGQLQIKSIEPTIAERTALTNTNTPQEWRAVVSGE